MKTIQSNARVILEYTLHDDKGELLDSSDGEDGEPILYVHGYGMLVPGLEKALEGLEVGQSKTIDVDAEEGFGERDEDLVMEIDKGDFPDPKNVTVGDEVVAESPDGEEVPMTVVEVRDDSVVVDANHPLAGMALRYAVTVKELTAATEEEIAEAASSFEDAGYGLDAACSDPTHDHSHGHDHDHGHDHEPANDQGLVQLTSKKPS